MQINDLSYIGGFFDGEGSVCIGRRGKKDHKFLQLTISITQTNREILEWVNEVLGGTGRVKVKNPGHKTKALVLNLGYNLKICYELVWTSKKAEVVLKTLLPYLKVKLGQAKIALEYRTTYVETDGQYPRISTEVQQAREEHRARLMQLN
jgi:hypothetical protein